MATDRPIVVLGAGINGAAIAREFALSGAAVVVVDAADVASGSTAWSTRLIHGGLRYLEYGEVGLVRESLAERDRLVRLAPHLVRPLPFCLPLQRRLGGLRSAAARILGLESLARRWTSPGGRGSIAVAIGLALYDLLATGSRWPRHRILKTGPADLPALDPTRFPFVATYADAQLTWPERFTVELLVDARRAAAAAGAPFEVHTHARARLQPDGSLTIHPVAGATAAGVTHGDTHHDARPRTFRPAAIVNATGAWADRTLAGLFGAEPATEAPCSAAPATPARRLIGGTKGSHLVLRSKALRAALRDQAVYAEAADGRPVFVIPFAADLVLVGTTDIPFTGDPATARADDREIDYLLAATGRLFPAAAPTREQIQQHYCGVRPLPATAGAGSPGPPAAITRRHMLVRHPAAPLPTWSVVGGKLTTCRALAAAAAREILPAIGLAVTGSSRTRPLPGFFRVDGADEAADDGFADAAVPCVLPLDRDDVIQRATAAAHAAGFAAADAAAAADALVMLFGSRAPDVFVPTAEAAPPRLIAGTALPLAAVGFCIREEWAATIEDIVERRLMLSFEPALSRGTLDDVAGELARLGRLPADGVTPAAAACAAFLRARYDRRFADDR